MNEIIIILFTAILFFIFTPGIFFTISKKLSKTNNAVIHAFLFAFIVYLIHIIFYNNIYEGLISDINGNYPIACNSSNLGERNKNNENNYVCIQDTNTKKYMWGLECKNSKDLNNKNDKNQVCELDNNYNYNWNTKK